MPGIVLAPELRLPWESTVEDDRRFLRLLRNMLLTSGVIFVVVPLLPVSDPTLHTLEEAPPEFVQILMEEKPVPEPVKPPPRIEKRIPEPPEPVKRAKEKPLEKPAPVDPLLRAREVAAESGLLAFQDDLSEMRDSVDLSTLEQTQMHRGQERAAMTERAMLTSGVRTDSGGIKTTTTSRDAGGVALSARETTRVQNTIAIPAKSADKGRSARIGQRSEESIRRVMDENKGVIFSIYNRALRLDPLLQGKLAFEMVIDRSGGVVALTLLSSELADAALTDKILARLRLINFGAQDVTTTSVNYSLDFLPYS